MARGQEAHRGRLKGVPPKPLQFHPAAVFEAGAAFQWYQERSDEAARAFLAELDRAIAQIEEAPGRWPSYLDEIRRFVLRRFPYAVVYREGEEVVRVIAVTHARRRPGYWQGR